MTRAARAAAVCSVAALALAVPATASAAPGIEVLGEIDTSTADRQVVGTDTSLFGGRVQARCPKGTLDAYFDISGRDIGIGAPAGSGDMGYLGASTNPSGTGPQSFSGASIANLKTTNAGSFASSGVYVIRFHCVAASGRTTHAYERLMDYTAGGPGRFRLRQAPPPPLPSTAPPAPEQPEATGPSAPAAGTATPGAAGAGAPAQAGGAAARSDEGGVAAWFDRGAASGGTLLGAGGLLAVGGAVLLLLRGRRSDEATEAGA